MFDYKGIEIIAADQELTLDYVKIGQAVACLSTASQPVSSANVAYLGVMDYALVGSPALRQKHFMQQPRKGLTAVRGIKFDHDDVLHDRYVEKYFGMSGADIDFHYVPLLQAFKQFALSGLGYGLIPILDIVIELRSKALINLFPTKMWSVPLYWHYWSIPSEFFKRFNEAMLAYGRQKLERVPR